MAYEMIYLEYIDHEKNPDRVLSLLGVFSF